MQKVSSCVFFRTALSEKKAVLKPKSPEKSKPDEKDVEKSPAKKTEGWYNFLNYNCTQNYLNIMHLTYFGVFCNIGIARSNIVLLITYDSLMTLLCFTTWVCA